MIFSILNKNKETKISRNSYEPTISVNDKDNIISHFEMNLEKERKE